MRYPAIIIACCALLLMLLAACAPLQPASPLGARGNEAPYPVLFVEDSHRKDTTIATINHLLSANNNGAPRSDLQPITGTIESLPANNASILYLPKVGSGASMTEEEIREALRRFIKDWQGPIGADPAKLSLVERVDQPDGTKLARYEQRPFRYPIRGNYGSLQIHFTSDRRVLDLLSTCIPDADKIQTALAAIVPKLKAEDAIKQVAGADVQYSTLAGGKQTIRPAANNQLTPHELVIHIAPNPGQSASLAFRIAWEIEISNAPVKFVYVDAVSGDVIGAA